MGVFSGYKRLPRVARLVLPAVGAVLLFVAVQVVPPWINALTSPALKRQATTAFLNVLLVAYLGAVGLAAVGGVALTAGLLLRKGSRRTRLWMAKGLLLSASCLVSFALTEWGAHAWHAWKHRSPDLAARAVPPEEPPDPLHAASASVGGEADPGKPLKILVIGESSARGEPYQDWLSVGDILGWQLGKVFPGREVEVDMQAEPGVSLEYMHQKLANIDYRPDVLVLFAGHNEFQARFSWVRNIVYYDYEREKRPEASPVELMLNHSPVCRLILETLEKQKIPVAPKKVVTRGVVDGPAYTPDEKRDMVADFRRRLDSIATYCERLGTVPVFVCPASNDRDFDPSRSVVSPRMTRAEIAAFEARFLKARGLVPTDPAGAKALLAALVEEQPVYAEAHYWYARVLESEGDLAGAKRHYVLARERDGMPIRCLEEFREQYRAVSREHPSVVLVDSDAVLTPLTSGGVLSDHQYHDAHHPTLLSYVALTQDALDQIADRKLLGWPEGTPAPRIDPDACEEHFDIDQQRWATVLERSGSFYERTAFMRFDPSARERKAELFREASRKVAAGTPPGETGVPGVGTRPTEEPGGVPAPTTGEGL